MKRCGIIIALIAAVGAFPGSAVAGNFTVTPVRIYMAPNERATAITITNESDETLVMQADLYEWKQKPDGQDELTPTEDMILSPPIIKMAPRSRQVVRLARLAPISAPGQTTYRMVVREIPEAKPAEDKVQVQIALAFSMPVFITPPGAKAKLNCTVERTAGNSVDAVCENDGSAYSHPVTLTLNGTADAKIAENQTGGYILPGIKRRFTLKRDAVIEDGPAKLAVMLDDGAIQSYDVTISR